MAELPKISPRQEDALKFIIRYRAEHGVPPSRREISRALHFSSHNPSIYIEPLLKRGFLSKAKAAHRNLVPTALAEDWYRSTAEGAQRTFVTSLFTPGDRASV